ncbi:MAG: hypothetical protein M1818_001248 [Claussenomyces sp. TS43310]|nr:MAG: hypothetical protein M1818_001248 [Claussenomyces sp. TS43310]
MHLPNVLLSLGLNAALTAASTTCYGNSVTGSVWQPSVGASWQIVLQNKLDPTKLVTPDVGIFDIDMFENPNSTIAGLHAKNKKVICYFSAGSYEPGRPDSGSFTAADKGAELDGWPGEYWLDLRSTNVRNIMVKRLRLAQSKGCDAVDPDNVDGFQNDNGLGLTAQDSIDFMNFLAANASSLGLAIGLKNAGDIIDSVLPKVQFSVNEQCINFTECDTFAAFIDAGKPVFHIEYPTGVPSVSAQDFAEYCDTDETRNATEFSTVLKNMDLDGPVEFCDGTNGTTALSS